MKNLIFSLIFLFPHFIFAQYVTIPDANFRTFLQQQYPSCFNGNGQLNTQCPDVVNALSLNCSQSQISTLDGIQHFVNLTELICSYNQLPSLPMLPSGLTNLECNDNQLTSLPTLPSGLANLLCFFNQLTSLPALPSGLTNLDCFNNQLTSLPTLPIVLTNLQCTNNQLTSLPMLPNSLQSLVCTQNRLTSLPTLPSGLTFLSCETNQLTSLPTLPNGITDLYCHQNQLTSLPALPSGLIKLTSYENQLTSLPALPTDLTDLSCSFNQLTSLPALPSGLTGLLCGNNRLTNLPVLPSGLTNLLCENNQLTILLPLPSGLIGLLCGGNRLTNLPTLPSGLTILTCDNNQLTSLPALPSGLQTLLCSDNQLTCLPILPSTLGTGISNITFYHNPITCLPNIPNAFVASLGLPLCTNPSQICNGSVWATGLVYHDANSNGVKDSGESAAGNMPLSSLPGNYHSLSLPYGYYIQVDSQTTNTISLNSPNPAAWTVAPPSHTIQVAGGGQVPGSYDFGLQSLNVTDLETVLFAGAARPGFTQNISISINNIGSTDPTTDITLTIPNGWQVTNTTPTATSIVGNVVTWTNVNVALFSSMYFTATVQIPATTSLGTPYTYTATTSAAFSDGYPINNTYSTSGTVRGSFDPNDKQVNPSVLSPNYDANMDFIYTVRFQNTGTDTAFTVMIRDTLATQYLDAGTFRVVNASHEYQVNMRGGANVEIIFPRINLVDSFTNEPLSHGFVQFAIKPKANLPLNTRIPNTAAIYFDFNSPIITNTAVTDILLSTTAIEAGIQLHIAPNPTDSRTIISFDTKGKSALLNVTDALGRVVEVFQLEGVGEKELDMNNLAKGLYFLSLVADGKVIGNGKVVRN